MINSSPDALLKKAGHKVSGDNLQSRNNGQTLAERQIQIDRRESELLQRETRMNKMEKKLNKIIDKLGLKSESDDLSHKSAADISDDDKFAASTMM